MISTRIPFSQEEMDFMRGKAKYRLAQVERANINGNYRNDENSHMIGIMGEAAVVRWAKENRFQYEWFARNDVFAPYDILLDGQIRTEVKTWQFHQYPELGRAVHHNQLNKLDGIDALVWVSVYEDVAFIKGWNTPDDMRSLGVEINKGTPSRQIAQASVRPPNTLWELLWMPIGV